MASSAKAAAQLELCLRVAGQRAFVIAETGSRLRSRRLAQHLRAAGWEPRAIAIGQVAVYAVRSSGEGLASLADLEGQLKRRYRMVVCEPGFSEGLYQVARELAETAEAEFVPVEQCVICGQPDPFPTVLAAVTPEGEMVRAPYCAQCVSASEASTYGRLCRSLLEAAGNVFGALRDVPLGRARRKGAVLCFPIDTQHLASAS